MEDPTRVGPERRFRWRVWRGAPQMRRSAEDRCRRASSVPWKLTGGARALGMGSQTILRPERVAGRLAGADPLPVNMHAVSYSIRVGCEGDGVPFGKLRWKGRKRIFRNGRSVGRGLIAGCTDISERPEVMDLKSRTCDWEVDLVIGTGHGGLGRLGHVRTGPVRRRQGHNEDRVEIGDQIRGGGRKRAAVPLDGAVHRFEECGEGRGVLRRRRAARPYRVSGRPVGAGGAGGAGAACRPVWGARTRRGAYASCSPSRPG